MALCCTHGHRSPATSRENVAACDKSATSGCPPQCRSDNSPPPTPLLPRIAGWKTFKDCKRRCGTKTRICIHNTAEAAPLAGSTGGEPPQYTALVDCRRRWEVRLGLGGGSLGPQIDPRRPEPACDRTIRAGGESRPLALLHPPRGLPPPPSCLESPALISHCYRPSPKPLKPLAVADSLNSLARQIGIPWNCFMGEREN